MSSFGTLLNLALVVLTISTTAGLGLVIGRVKGLTQRADSADAEAVSLRARVEDRDAQIDTLTREREALRLESERLLLERDNQLLTMQREHESKVLAMQAASDAKVAQLERDLEAIGRVVTNEAHIVALQHQLEEHHAAALTGLSEIEATLVQIRDAVRTDE